MQFTRPALLSYARRLVHKMKLAYWLCNVCAMQAGATSPDVSTPVGASRSSLIRLLYGAAVADTLLEAGVSSSNISEQATGKRKRPKLDIDDMEEAWSESDDEAVPLGKRSDKTKWKAQAVFTNTSFQGKKLALLLFINRKLDESWINAC
jgi:hypothetical protein